MLQEQNALGLKVFCESLHPATVAAALEGEFTPEQIWEILSHADIGKQAAIFEYLPSHVQVEMAKKVRPQLAELIARMSHDDRVDLLQRLAPEVREALLRLIDEADRRDIASLFAYAENTVGALMTTDYAWIPAHVTAAEAIDLLRAQAPDKETIYYI
jgi:magnesium transporter